MQLAAEIAEALGQILGVPLARLQVWLPTSAEQVSLQLQLQLQWSSAWRQAASRCQVPQQLDPHIRRVVGLGLHIIEPSTFSGFRVSEACMHMLCIRCIGYSLQPVAAQVYCQKFEGSSIRGLPGFWEGGLPEVYT
jgi:hypothetical protein